MQSCSRSISPKCSHVRGVFGSFSTARCSSRSRASILGSLREPGFQVFKGVVVEVASGRKAVGIRFVCCVRRSDLIPGKMYNRCANARAHVV